MDLSGCKRQREAMEEAYFAPGAARSAQSRGRCRPEEPCPLRTAYQQDRDRILHCGAFRRLKHKTQVFLGPRGDNYRTRLTHTLEVAQIARTIASGLRPVPVQAPSTERAGGGEAGAGGEGAEPDL